MNKGIHMKLDALNFAQKLGLIDELWSPRVIAEMNDSQFNTALASSARPSSRSWLSLGVIRVRTYCMGWGIRR